MRNSMRNSMRKLFSFLPSFTPVTLPPAYAKRAFRFAPGWQIGIALMLNILSLAVPVMTLQIYDRIIPHQSYGTLTVLTACVLVALAADAALRLVRAWLTGWAAASLDHAAGLAAVARLSRAKLSALQGYQDSDYLQAFNALGRLREFYSGQAICSLVDMPFVALYLGLIAYLGGWLVVVPAALLFLFAAAAQVSGTRLRAALASRMKADEDKAGIVMPVLKAMHTLKSLGAELPMLRRFEARQVSVTNESYRVALAGGEAATLGAVFAQLSFILTAAFGCAFVIDGRISVRRAVRLHIDGGTCDPAGAARARHVDAPAGSDPGARTGAAPFYPAGAKARCTHRPPARRRTPDLAGRRFRLSGWRAPAQSH